MNLAPTFLELRKHPRAQLKLPARVRWRGPLGMRMESAHTLDVSRNGIRVQRSESCELGSRVWVVFPFDAVAASGVPPETPARVVRVESAPGGGYQVALQLELPREASAPAADRERRACSRMSFARAHFRARSRFPLAGRIHDPKYLARRSPLRISAHLLRGRRRPRENSLG